jgi:hypothetical protein
MKTFSGEEILKITDRKEEWLLFNFINQMLKIINEHRKRNGDKIFFKISQAKCEK